MVARGGGWGGGWVKWMKVVIRYKLPVIKQISPGDVIYSMVTIINYTVIYLKVIKRVNLKKFSS